MKQPKTIRCPRCCGRGETLSLRSSFSILETCHFCGGTGSLLKPAKKPSTKPKPKRKAQ